MSTSSDIVRTNKNLVFFKCQQPQAFLARLNFIGAGPSGVKFFEEAEGSDPAGSDNRVEVDLDDEPGSLLDFLRKVASSSFWAIHGLSRSIEPELLDFFTSQLDRELISHNLMVNDLKRKMSQVFLKARKFLAVLAELR